LSSAATAVRSSGRVGSLPSAVVPRWIGDAKTVGGLGLDGQLKPRLDTQGAGLLGAVVVGVADILDVPAAADADRRVALAALAAQAVWNASAAVNMPVRPIV
jgi:hypothetical protein